MHLIDMPSLAYAKDSASYLEWVEDRLCAKGTPDYQKLDRMAKETEELFAGEKRLTGEPYHAHCFSVPIIGVEYARVSDPDVVAALTGHDNPEFVEEQMEKGVYHPRFNLWRAESGLIEERFSYKTERLIRASTAPRVNSSRSSAESHQIVYRRMHELANDLEYFQVRLSDRTHNLRTLTPLMGADKLHAKLDESTQRYIPYANHHGILVHELNNGVAYGWSLIQPALI